MADEKLISMVLLLKKPSQLQAADLRTRLSRSLGMPFGTQRYERNIVVQFKPGMIGVRYDDQFFGVMVVDRPYVSRMPPDLDRYDARVRLAMVNHKGWIGVDLVNQSPSDDRRRAYQMIGRILAEVLDADAMAIYAPEIEQMMYVHEGTRDCLLSGNPLSALQTPDPPVLRISAKDPQMAEAVAEARRRWPEFLAAFERRRKGQGFAIKFCLSDGNNSEFIWMQVTSIRGDIISGQLANEPRLDGFRDGQLVEAKIQDINDWIYEGTTEMVGGFTTKVLERTQREKQ